MDLSGRFHRAVATVLLPLFLVASVLCVCGSAAAIGGSAEAPHSCCPDEGRQEHGSGPAPYEHHADCNHCGQSQITPEAAVELPAPQITSSPWLAALPASIRTDGPVRVSVVRLGGAASTPHAPGPLFRLKCALLI